MERRQRADDEDSWRRRSRSYSPVSSRLRYQIRRRHLRPPPVPRTSHRRRRRTTKGSDVNSKRSRSRSRSNHGSRSSRRKTDSMAPRSRSRSRSRSRFGSRKRKKSSTRSHTATSDGHRCRRNRHSGRKRSKRGEGQKRGRRSSTEKNHSDRHRSSRAKKKHRHSRRHDSYHDREPLLSPPVTQPHKDDSEDSVAHDDTVGSYSGKPGEYIANRYKIIREAGLGTFGRVLECLDKQRNIVVAIKVVRKVEKYTESAKIEAAILQDVNDKDKNNQSLCVRMYKWFEYKGHVCMVFERLGCSLYEYLKNHDYKPFPLHCIRAYAWQLLTSLEFIHSIRLVHTDLKPENILLVDDEEERASCDSSSPSSTSSYGSRNGSSGRENWSNGRQWKKRDRGCSDVDSDRLSLRPPASNAVKLIDFGGATYEDESKSSIINTRQYRSPEVILGLGWSYPSDIWSAGCIIAELYLGELLFATHENMEHLALIERCINPLPVKMVAQASKNSASASFFYRGRLNWPAGSSSDESVDHVRRMRSLADLISPEDAKSGLLELLQLMLVLDPEKRVTAKEALNTPFFDGFSYRHVVKGGHSV
ncbi:putative protein kinase [Plasmopara halstedii]